MDGLEARVRRLEAQNQRLRRGGGMALLLVATFVAIGQAAAEPVREEVRTRKVTIVDAEGRERGSWDAGRWRLREPVSRAEAEVRVEKGQILFSLVPGFYGYGLQYQTFQSDGGKNRDFLNLGSSFSLRDDSEGERYVAFGREAASGARVELALGEDGSPLLLLRDDEGRVRVRAYVTRLLDEAGIDLLDAEGKPIHRLR